MTCTAIKLEGGVAIVCTREPPRRARACSSCGTSTKDYHLCDFPLRGKRAGATCSKPVCTTCTTPIGENRDLCPPHMRMAREHGLDLNLLSESQGNAGKQVALDQLEANGAPVAPRERNRALSPIKFRQHKVTVPGKGGFYVSAVEDWQEYLIERAAIGEYLGELPRDAAERQARELAGPRPK